MLRDVGYMQDILYANSCKYKTRITNIIRGFILEFKIFFSQRFYTLYYYYYYYIYYYILYYYTLYLIILRSIQ